MRETKLHYWPEIQEYKLEEILGRGGMGAVYQAIPLQDRTRRVAIKVIDNTGHIPHEAIVNFQKEAALMGQLYHPNIVYFVNFGRIKSTRQNETSYFIVMELVKGQSLKEYLQSEKFQSLDDVSFLLAVGKQLAAALDYTHSRGIIHRDIKPQNIMIDIHQNNLEEMSIKLLDFGVAGLSDAYQSLGLGKMTGIEDFAGTPLYQAPEQSGLTGIVSDHRVDLYSLGCLFFEILAKKPPFTGATRQELLQKHQEQDAPRLKDLRPDIPAVLSDMVEKCLKKNPNERYGSAFSLLADLIQLEKIIQKNSQGFQLGKLDGCNPLISTTKLIGRHREFESLISFYNALDHETRSRISVISGPRGSGKSRLVKELRKNLISRKVRFVSGTFTRYDANLSFNCLALAFDDYLIKLRRDLPEEAELLKERFKEILGDSLVSLLRVIPGLQSYTSPVQEIDTSETETDPGSFLAKNFLDFTSCLMRQDQPLVFIFEDLHLADAESLELIDAFFTNANSERIYLVISHLRTEGSQSLDAQGTNQNKLSEFLEKIQKLKRRAQQIYLHPLSADDSSALIEEVLQDQHVSVDFKKWMNSHCNGNPIQLLETTKSLILQRKLIKNDTEWVIDLGGISQIEFRTNNADIDLAKIERYPESHRSAIKIAAVIGSKFTEEHLSIDSLADPQIVSETIAMAKKDGIFKPIRNPDGTPSSYLEFLHLGVLEMVLQGMQVNEKKQLYIRVARSLLKKKGDDNFFLRSVRLLNEAHTSLGGLDTNDQKIALDANISAARKAAALNDDEFAIDFFNITLMKYLNPSQNPEDYGMILLEKVNLLMRKNLQQKTILSLLRKTTHLKLSNKLQAEIKDALFQCYLELGNTVVGHQIATNTIKGDKKTLSIQELKNIFKSVLNMIADIFYAYNLLGKYSSISKLRNGRVTDRYLSVLLGGYNKAILCYSGNKFQELQLQIKAGNIAMRGQSGEQENVIFLLSRLSFIWRHGFKRSAKRILNDIGYALHNPSEASICRIAMTKNVLMDHQQQGKLAEFVNLAKKYTLLGGPDRLVLESNHRILVAWHYLMKGQLIRAKDESLIAFRRTPTTHSLSSFYLYVFSLSCILLGDRSEVAEQYRNWKKSRRNEFKTHKKDLFERLVESFVSAIRSEADLTHQQFVKITQSIYNIPHNNGLEHIQRLAFDFYLVLFPLFAQSEFGTSITERSKPQLGFPITSFMLRLGEAFQIIYPKKVTKILRKVDRLFQPKEFDDSAMDTIKILRYRRSSQNLLELFRKIDAANKVWNSIHRVPEDAEIIENLIKSVNLLNYPGLSSILERMLAALNYHSTQKVNSGTIKKINSDRYHFISNLPSEVASHFCVDPLSTSFETCFHNFSEICQKYASAAGVYFLPAKDFPFLARTLSGTTPIEDVQNNLQDLTDLSFVTLLSINLTKSGAEVSHNFNKPLFDFSETVYLQTKYANPKESSQRNMDDLSSEWENSLQDRVKTDSPTKVSIKSPEKSHNLGAVLPLYFHEFKIGHIFIQELKKEYQANHHEAIKELSFASRIFSSFLFVKYNQEFQFEQKISNIKPLAYIERCDWLNVWLHGFHNNDPDSTWFYSAKLGSEKYIIGHVNVQSPVSRQSHLARLLWSCFQEWIHEYKGNPSLADLRSLEETMGWVLQNWADGVIDLKSLDVACALIHRGDYRVETFSFGHPMAIILGGDNKQKIHNHAIVAINQGARFIYRYSGGGSLDASLPLICAREPQSMQFRLDSSARSAMRQAFQEIPDAASTADHRHGVIRKFVGLDYIPRYYAGFIKKNSRE